MQLHAAKQVTLGVHFKDFRLAVASGTGKLVMPIQRRSHDNNKKPMLRAQLLQALRSFTAAWVAREMSGATDRSIEGTP